ncbi:Maf-like protein [Spirochaetia bacterium]|nr:Maf-like protein [Spirochaetia bacterium]
MEPIILASGSLRRQEYFRLMGLPFSIMPAQINEEDHDPLPPRKLAEELAVRKVNAVVDLLTGRHPGWIFGADTLLQVDGEVYGKPAGREDAQRMLNTLQGRSHHVITAMALYSGKAKDGNQGSIDCRSVVSDVTFAPLSPEDIAWYLDSGEWQGAAGAYKVQGLAGCFVSEIRGSYSGIVGLPLHEFYVMLRENGYSYG